MIKILQVCHTMYPRIGGIEQVARDIANVLKSDSEIEQKIICFNENAEADGYECHRRETIYDKVDGIEVVRCGSIAKIASQQISLTYPRELKKIFDTFVPDMVIFHYPNPFLAEFLLHRLERETKLILYWHLDITKQKVLGKLFHPQNIALIKRADKIAGATPIHLGQSAYTRYFGNKKVLLPYMIDEKSLELSHEEVQHAKAVKERYKGKMVGLFVGRHVPYKGLSYLIEASRILGECDFKFLIAGTGPLTDELKKQAKDDKKIEFLGKISNSERREYLYACDVICFPSVTRNEGFGLALAEGMYFGKPAVTFTIPGSGVNYVNLNGVTGIECPNGDSRAYAEALRKLASNSCLRAAYGKAARERVLDNFTGAIFERNLLRLVRDLKEGEKTA